MLRLPDDMTQEEFEALCSKYNLDPDAFDGFTPEEVSLYLRNQELYLRREDNEQEQNEH
jgi:hypothetical protein